jgi:hypothetical protein
VIKFKDWILINGAPSDQIIAIIEHRKHNFRYWDKGKLYVLLVFIPPNWHIHTQQKEVNK